MNVMMERKTLIDNLFPDVKLGLKKARRKTLRQGKTHWGENRGKAKQEYVVRPVQPLYLEDRRESGRSVTYHAERVAEMTQRYQEGRCLWTGGEPDTESFVGTELTLFESQLIGMVLNG